MFLFKRFVVCVVIFSILRPSVVFAAPAPSSSADAGAAGVFFYYVDSEQRSWALVSKRACGEGEGTHGSLGGLRDPEETDEEAAIREAREESFNIIAIPLEELTSANSHTLEQDSSSSQTTYRMFFFQSQEFISADSPNSQTTEDSEQIDFTWVLLPELKEAVRHKKHVSFTCRGDSETETFQKELQLFLPFADLLRSPDAQLRLEEIIAGTTVNASLHTKSSPSLTIEDEYAKETIEISRLELEGASNSENASVNQPCTSESSNLQHKEAASSYSSSQNEERSTSESEGKSWTQTETVIKMALGEKATGDYAKDLKLFLEEEFDIKRYLNHPEDFDLSDLRTQLTDIAIKEKKHPHDYVAYHGISINIALMYQFLSHIRNILMETNLGVTTLRTLDHEFSRFTSIDALYKEVKKQGRDSLNYRGPYTKLAISALAYLLGGDGITLSRFLGGWDDMHVSDDEIESFLRHLSFSEQDVRALMDEYKALESKLIEANKGGAPLQMIIPENCLEKNAYAAVSGGGKLKLSHDEKKDANPNTILSAMKKGPKAVEKLSEQFNIVDRSQLRLLLTPKITQSGKFSTHLYVAGNMDENPFDKVVLPIAKKVAMKFIENAFAPHIGMFFGATDIFPLQKRHQHSYPEQEISPPPHAESWAIESNDKEILNTLNVDEQLFSLYTGELISPYIYALTCDQQEAAELLRTRGAKIDEVFTKERYAGLTPLFVCMLQDEPINAVTLLKHGANPDFIPQDGSYAGVTALLLASSMRNSLPVLQRLNQSGVRITEPSRPLMKKHTFFFKNLDDDLQDLLIKTISNLLKNLNLHLKAKKKSLSFT
ncbi:MAG: NUDIX domain-containing protein [Alphaproteobacteria bacterium]|jgi:hypothetical protein|nr:NUDIX domain-containing protein [Alphaproteobacteria bacterium]MBT5389234.1 NUDIX domain-containing protein [Alphaproteobacteria bacterium]MBT5654008.1 NUDIX domain-containing protein [Alphaproteobacteria bacterium]